MPTLSRIREICRAATSAREADPLRTIAEFKPPYDPIRAVAEFKRPHALLEAAADANARYNPVDADALGRARRDMLSAACLSPRHEQLSATATPYTSDDLLGPARFSTQHDLVTAAAADNAAHDLCSAAVAASRGVVARPSVYPNAAEEVYRIWQAAENARDDLAKRIAAEIHALNVRAATAAAKNAPVEVWLEIVRSEQQVRIFGAEVVLSRPTWRLLLALAEGAAEGRALVSKERLEKILINPQSEEKALAKAVSRAKKDLSRSHAGERIAKIIANVRSAGYRLDIPARLIRIRD